MFFARGWIQKNPGVTIKKNCGLSLWVSGSLLRDRLDNPLPLPPSLKTRPSLDCYAQITTPKQTETEKTRRAACFIFLITIVSSKLLFSLLCCPLLKIHVQYLGMPIYWECPCLASVTYNLLLNSQQICQTMLENQLQKLKEWKQD